MVKKAQKHALPQYCEHCHDRKAVYHFSDLPNRAPASKDCLAGPGRSYWCAECFRACYPALAKLMGDLERRTEVPR
jgi:hypothetical protein